VSGRSRRTSPSACRLSASRASEGFAEDAAVSGLVSCGDAPSVEPQLKPRLVYVDSVDLDKSAVPDRTTVSRNGRVRASVTVTNTGSLKGDEVVQLYIHDPVARISQPVRRLRGFERVTLDPDDSRRVTFTLDRSDLGFYDNSGRFVVEPGEIHVFAGTSLRAELTQSFTVRRG
jgi:hypothetical protein